MEAFQDKFVAFVDVLGFKELVRDAHDENSPTTLEQILKILETLGRVTAVRAFQRHGPMVCPQSEYNNRDLDLRVLQVSDCAIFSCEISPVGIANLISEIWKAQVNLMKMGILCRGYITRGMVYHTWDQVIGEAYQRAFVSEGSSVAAFKIEADELGTPFVELDKAVVDFFETCADKCSKQMINRMIESDGTVSAIYPFKRLSPQIPIDHTFSPKKGREKVSLVRGQIQHFKELITSRVSLDNQKAMKKTRHYVSALDRQLEECDQVDLLIDTLSRPFPN